MVKIWMMKIIKMEKQILKQNKNSLEYKKKFKKETITKLSKINMRKWKKNMNIPVKMNKILIYSKTSNKFKHNNNHKFLN